MEYKTSHLISIALCFAFSTLSISAVATNNNLFLDTSAQQLANDNKECA
ncbi:hypothetical protein BPUTEOMOX_2004 [methanotrophic endosymbiont of Bathymodiolus puteoserpentis (Logatchev)]|nr:hypothetical protein BPUTEOMOX_2004 [methanotrophic endosymbiont of Bathymodiolus puteoserpentis (Logatchev)]